VQRQGKARGTGREVQAGAGAGAYLFMACVENVAISACHQQKYKEETALLTVLIPSMPGVEEAF